MSESTLTLLKWPHAWNRADGRAILNACRGDFRREQSNYLRVVEFIRQSINELPEVPAASQLHSSLRSGRLHLSPCTPQLLRNPNRVALEKELFNVLEIRSVQIDLVFSFSYTGSILEKTQRLDKP